MQTNESCCAEVPADGDFKIAPSSKIINSIVNMFIDIESEMNLRAVSA